MTSPTLIPTRNSIRCAGERPDVSWMTATWNSSAQRTASTALANSAMKPSPVLLTIRPRWRATDGAMMSAIAALNRAWVASSSSCMSRE